MSSVSFVGLSLSGTIAALLAVLVSYLVLYYVNSPLRGYPGPLLAKWTNLYRLSIAVTDSYPRRIKKLHDKYGPVVCIGPNTLDLDIPELIKTIYTTDGKFIKSDLYSSNCERVNGKLEYNLFSMKDPAEHRRTKSPIARHYSLSSVIQLEPLIDTEIARLCSQLEARFMNKGEESEGFDLGSWVAFCTWDLVGSVSFSTPFGYLDFGSDFDHTIEIGDKWVSYFATVGQMPLLDQWLLKNPVIRIGPPAMKNAVGNAIQHIMERQQGNDVNYNANQPDYLHHFLLAKESHSDVVSDMTVVGYLLNNLLAGADSTATLIRAVIYFLVKLPEAQRKLTQDLRAASLGDVANYEDAKALPYLEAVIRESMRLHPSVNMALERYVPSEGLTLPDGSSIPPGVGIGINPYIVHRNKEVWGEDAGEFRPERWLPAEGESDDAFQSRLRLYNATDFTFGGGSRICIGRNLALVETYKIVATLFSRYDIELDDPKREWKTPGNWFYSQTGLICKLKKRV